MGHLIGAVTIFYIGALLWTLTQRRRNSHSIGGGFCVRLGISGSLLLLGVAIHPLFFSEMILTPFVEALLALLLYFLLSLRVAHLLILYLRAGLGGIFLLTLVPLTPHLVSFEAKVIFRILHLVSLFLGFYTMTESAASALLYVAKERSVRFSHLFLWARGLPPLETLEENLRFSRRISLIALGTGIVTGFVLGEIRKRMIVDFYAIALLIVFLTLVGMELYGFRGKRWGKRFATMAVVAGCFFIFVWVVKLLDLIPHYLHQP